MHMTASTREIASRRDHGGADLDAEVTQRVILAGLTLERTAATAGDPLVRRNIEKVLDELDQVVQAVRDAGFGTEHHLNAGGLRKQPGPCQGTAMSWSTTGLTKVSRRWISP
jgi:hypothetical protein